MTIKSLSVITISYQAEEQIEETLFSVAMQADQDFEYALIDGGSSDSTMQIANKYKTAIDIMMSEPDSGISDAMNKGVMRTNGQYLLFLNSGDRFLNANAISHIKSEIASTDRDIIAFDIILDSGTQLTNQHSRPFNTYVKYRMPFCHQAVVCSRTLFDKIGPFNLNYNFAMDYDFFLRAFINGSTCHQVKYAVTIFKLDGISSDKRWPVLSKRLSEERSINISNCESKFQYILYVAWWSLFWPYKWLKTRLGR